MVQKTKTVDILKNEIIEDIVSFKYVSKENILTIELKNMKFLKSMYIQNIKNFEYIDIIFFRRSYTLCDIEEIRFFLKHFSLSDLIFIKIRIINENKIYSNTKEKYGAE